MARPVKPANLTKEAQAFKRAADAFVLKATSSQKSARKVMIEIGVQDAKGNLTRNYR